MSIGNDFEAERSERQAKLVQGKDQGHDAEVCRRQHSRQHDITERKSDPARAEAYRRPQRVGFKESREHDSATCATLLPSERALC